MKNEASAQRYGRKAVSASKERWNESKAILLLQRTGKLVQGIETSGTRMPQRAREQCHTRLVAAHDARDMTDYRSAVKAYEEAAREAYRKAKKGVKREEG